MALSSRSPATWTGWAAAALVWALGWAAMAALQSQVDLANLAMVLVLASALATLWLPLPASLVCSAAAVLAFNWFFVPPRFTWSVDLRQHALLLLAMLGVSWIVAALVSRQRRLAEQARRYAEQTQQLQRFGEALRDAAEPAQQAGLLQETLAHLLGTRPHLLVLRRELSAASSDDDALWLGEPTAHERTGLWQCLRQAQPFGPGTHRHAELWEWYFPLRGRQAAFGAAMVRLAPNQPPDDSLRLQAQALCDQMGVVLQRAQVLRHAEAAREEAQLQQTRNALLAAISHDFRTPLATILGAASSLRDQGDRLSAAQRQRLVEGIVTEAGQLRRLTDNTLQLARLDAPGMALRLEWESAEDLVGAVMARVRGRDQGERVHARVEPGLPLLRCDAMLMAQMLENLIDNALKYSEAPAPVEVLARRQAGQLVLAVRDRGPGVAPAWRERIFEVFQRGELQPAAGNLAQRSAGVGLAVCRAIARAHGGELKLRARGHGGAAFECWLPESPQPAPASALPLEEPAP